MQRLTNLVLCLGLTGATVHCADDSGNESDDSGSATEASSTDSTSGITDSQTSGTAGSTTGDEGSTTETDTSTDGDSTGAEDTNGDSSVVDCEQLAAEFQGVVDDAYAVDGDAAGGVAMAVHGPNCDLWSGAAGESERGQALTSEHRFRIASVTKTYVAASLLTLEAEGRISLDDRLEDHVPGVPNGDTISIRQLLNHQSGVYNYTEDEDFMLEAFTQPEVAVPPQEIVDVAIAHGPVFTPGEDWGYSNTNYILLGMILEQLEDSSAGASIRKRVLSPTELSETWLDGDESIEGNLAEGWLTFNDTTEAATHIQHPSVPWTAGSMVATPADTTRWVRALFGGDVLNKEQLEAMTTPVEADIPGLANAAYGLGVVIFDFGRLGIGYGHTGGIPGYLTVAIYFEELEAAVTVVINNNGREQGLNKALEGAIDALLAGGSCRHCSFQATGSRIHFNTSM